MFSSTSFKNFRINRLKIIKDHVCRKNEDILLVETLLKIKKNITDKTYIGTRIIIVVGVRVIQDRRDHHHGS